MPSLIQKPNVIVDCTLDCEEHKPIEDRIVWKARVLSSGDRGEYDAELERIYAMRGAEKNKGLNALIRRVAIGWDNIVGADGAAAPFSDETLDLFSLEAKTTFAMQLPAAAGWGDIRKKKSPSQ